MMWARVIDSRMPVPIAGVRSPPSGETQKIVEVGASRTMPSGRTSSASSAPRACGDPGGLHVGPVGERLDAGQDDRRRVGDGRQAHRAARVRKVLDQQDPPPASRDDDPQLGVAGPELGEQRVELALQRLALDGELDRRRRALEPVEVVATARTARPRRGGSPRTRRRPGRGRRRAAGWSPRRSARSRRRRSPAPEWSPSARAEAICVATPSAPSISSALGVLDDRRHALADADAEGGDAVAAAAAAQLPDEGVSEAGAGAAERVAEGDRAAVDVEPLLVDPELAGAGEDLGGEGLVDLDQVDLVERQAGGVERPADRRRPGRCPCRRGRRRRRRWRRRGPAGSAPSSSAPLARRRSAGRRRRR